ncbi:TraR/DksA family transcriptional regulator [bacterium]|nr:TraR/DksA family transcriptional regulator [bacterium]
MNKEDLEDFKSIFDELENNSNLELLNFDLSKNEQTDSWDQIQEDRSKVLEFKLASRKKFFLAKIKIARDKLLTGEFGKCEECEIPIDLQRLKARPMALYCISCKEEQEQAENLLTYKKRSKTYSKGFINNSTKIEINGEEISMERVIAFNKDKAKIGLL